MKTFFLFFFLVLIGNSAALFAKNGVNMHILKDNTKANLYWSIDVASDTFPGYRGQPLQKNENEDFDSSFDLIIIGSRQEAIPDAMEISGEIPRQFTILPERALEVKNENAQLREIEYDYSGFKVEIAKAEEGLPDDHFIFSQHGNIYLEKRSDGSFGYLLGDFKTEAEAFSFFEKVLEPSYPDGRVAKFESGRRVW